MTALRDRAAMMRGEKRDSDRVTIGG